MTSQSHASGPACLQVGPLRLFTPVVLAPMAGVTDAPFRRLCRMFGEEALGGPSPLTGTPSPASLPSAAESARTATASGIGKESGAGEELTPHVDAPAGLYVMEMVTSRALVEGSARTMAMIRPDPAERVRSVQLYGVNPQVMARATQIMIEGEYADHIDLNFGCPVPKVTRKGGGAALPWKRDLYTDLLRAVVTQARVSGDARGREIPVTVKIRMGIDSEHETGLEAAQIAQELGAAAVTIHARTQTQHYAGQAHWDYIARVKEALDIPVFGNGDVFEAVDAMEMLRQTGCDGISVGRGAQGRPWIFRDIVAAYHGRPAFPAPSLREVAAIIKTHARWCVEEEGDEDRAMREMRKHIGWYLRGFKVGGPQRHALGMVSTLDELSERLADLDLDQDFPEAARGPRGRAGGEKTPHLPDGWLEHRYLTDAERASIHHAEVGY